MVKRKKAVNIKFQFESDAQGQPSFYENEESLMMLFTLICDVATGFFNQESPLLVFILGKVI